MYTKLIKVVLLLGMIVIAGDRSCTRISGDDDGLVEQPEGPRADRYNTRPSQEPPTEEYLRKLNGDMKPMVKDPLGTAAKRPVEDSPPELKPKADQSQVAASPALLAGIPAGALLTSLAAGGAVVAIAAIMAIAIYITRKRKKRVVRPSALMFAPVRAKPAGDRLAQPEQKPATKRRAA